MCADDRILTEKETAAGASQVQRPEKERRQEEMTESHRAKIAVLIPMEGDLTYWEECVEGLAGQSMSEFRAYCICGEAERARVEAVSAADPRFIPVERADSLGRSVNRLISDAREKYLVFVHPDDYCLPDYLMSGYLAAEENQADLVLYESGERAPKSGVHRERFVSLRKELLPGETAFRAEDIKGNSLRLTRTPTWLSMFRATFLREKGILSTERGLYWCIGQCAIAAAERICAVREPQAYLHWSKSGFAENAEQLSAEYGFLRRMGLWEKTGYNFAHHALKEIVDRLRTASTDGQRYEVLDWLCSEEFRKMDLLERESSWYRYGISAKNASFILAARREYERRLQAPEKPEPEEELIASRITGEIDVSVIIPVYNTAAYLDDALRSVMETGRRTEVLCMDDGSTDGSLEQLMDWARREPCIGVYRQANAGPSLARNRLLDHARGRYILFLDSDDALVEGAVEKLCEKADDEQLDLLIYNGEDHFEDGSRAAKPFFFGRHGGVCSGPEMMARMQELEELITTVWLVMIRREFFDASGIRFHDGILHEDTPLIFELLLQDSRADCINDRLYFRRVRSNSIMTADPDFRHPYGVFVAYRDMWKAYESRRNGLNARERSAALHRLEWTLKAAREWYVKLPAAEIGSEYGLGEEFSLFKAFVGSWSEAHLAWIESKERGKKAEADLRKAKR